MTFDKTQGALLEYVNAHPFWKIIKVLAELLLCISAIGGLVGNFIDLGVIDSLFSILFYVGFVLTLAKGNYKVITIGTGVKVLDYVVSILKNLIKYKHFAFGSVIWVVCYILIMISAFKKSGMTVKDMKDTMTIDGLKKATNIEEAKTFNVNEAINSAKDVYTDTTNTMKDVSSQIKDLNNIDSNKEGDK